MCVLLFRNGYSLFCKKYFRKHTTIRPSDRFKVVGAAWRQLPLAKKKRYLEKGAKVSHEYFCYLILFHIQCHASN